MHECLLCRRDMNVSNNTFGNGCVRNIYSFLNLPMPREVKLREQTLFKKVMRLTNTSGINTRQKIWLTDRYLTNEYLKKIPYGNFNVIKNQISNDIKNIKQVKRNEEPKSAKNLSLKQAYDLYKKVMKFEEGLKKLSRGNITDAESIKTIITSISFIFNMSRNKSQYEKDAFKGMQFAFWQTVIEMGGMYAEFNISADFLQHSLEKEPENMVISEGKVVQEIIGDESFKKNASNIIKKYGKNGDKFVFDSSKDNSFPMNFDDKDLYFAIHKCSLYLNGNKTNNKWNLEVKLHDRYDYSKAKSLIEYYNDTSSVAKSILSSTLYNLASFSVKSGVIKEYDIDINFYIEGFEVI